jgi:excisionase family DNA binding protein
MESELIGVREAATILGVSKNTVIRWAHAGRLPVALVIPGYRGDLLFDPVSVEALREGK